MEDAASYEFQGEDHTLGNALRWMIMKKYVPPSICLHLSISTRPFFTENIKLTTLQSRGRVLRLLNPTSLRTQDEYPNPNIQYDSFSSRSYDSLLILSVLEPYTPRQALTKGLEDLIALCDVVTDKFVEGRDTLLERKRRASRS